MKSEHHIYMLEKAAAALEPLNERLVYTGGAIVPVYLDTYTSEFRPTQDVDCN